MMFKKEMAELIFAGKKTQTRRLPEKSKRHYKVGSIQPVQIDYRHKALGHIRILKTYVQRLGEMTESEVKAEGFTSYSDYLEYLDEINGVHMMPLAIVNVYEFEVVKNEKNIH